MTVEKAKTYLKNYPCVCKYGTSPYDCKDREGCEFGKAIRTIIDNAPPAPERPQGEWYYGEDECGQDGWFCSECDFFVPWYYEYYEKDIDFIREYKACPHCLAEMVTYTGKDRDTEYKVTETPSEIRVEPTPIERLKAPFERVKENLNKAFGIKQPGKVMTEFWQKGKTE